MVFSSNIFLFALLPCVILGYYIIRRWRFAANLFLTLSSLLFYAWGEPKFVIIMIVSILCNWVFGLWVDGTRDKKGLQHLAIVFMVILNLGLLGVFKYAMLAMNTINWAFRLNLPVPEIALPIGISFFTFQAMSYVIDVKRGNGKVQKSLLNVALYITFFPQLIAGPIVRYQTIADEIEGRKETFDDFIVGARRFLIGLGKKVLIANNLAIAVDFAFSMKPSELSVVMGWLAAIGFLTQVYFDFSGYSDMAIGLGRMFGFHFLENFDHPVLSRSVTEFWRRWHISLSTWFRDYLYFPLGGSRVKSKARLLFNMCVVWSLTGLWHGADWKFLLWGFGLFIILAIERLTGAAKWLSRHKIGWLYAFPAVSVLTVLVRATSTQDAGIIYRAMLGLSGAGFWNDATTVVFKEYGIFMIAAFIGSLPLYDIFRNYLRVPDGLIRVVGGVLLVGLTLVAVTFVAMNNYNPFIYFNF